MALPKSNSLPESNGAPPAAHPQWASPYSGRAPIAVPARAVFDEFMRWTIEGEREALAPCLTPADREAFLGYYSKLPDPRNGAAVRRFLRGLWNSDTGWVVRHIVDLAESRATRHEPVRLLDAGSGFGTFSMLYACMGANVVAADLREDRLRVARQRLALFEERSGRRLEVQNVQSDVTLEMGPDFHVVHGSYTDDAGVVHRYAHERTFTPQELQAVLGANGPEVVHHELLYGGEGRLPAALLACVRAIGKLNRAGQRLARRHFVVARRSGARAAA